MLKPIGFCLSTVILAAICSDDAFGQTPAIPPNAAVQAPKTKMEAFTGATGIVSIKAYTTIGEVRGTGRAEVTAMTFRNAASGQAQSGITIEISEPGRSYSSPARSFIDYDEIQGLLDGITYIAKTDDSVTEHPFYEARYSTKGDFSIVVFNNANGLRQASIKSGTIGGQQMFVALVDLEKFKELDAKARSVLDNPGEVKRAAAKRAQDALEKQRAAERAAQTATEQPQPVPAPIPVPTQKKKSPANPPKQPSSTGTPSPLPLR
jgi:hypothetical protein